MGSNNLIDYLKEIQDFRTSRGRQYELWLILLLIIMGSLTGCHSYLALEDFAKRHHQALGEKLGLNLTRFPSDTTFRRIFHRLDFRLLAETFHCWMKHYVEIEPGEWFSIDGKSIKGTVNNSDNEAPKFCQLGISLQSPSRSSCCSRTV